MIAPYPGNEFSVSRAAAFCIAAQPQRGIDLIPIIETARGLSNLDAILAAGTRVRHVALGAGDFTLDVSMAWSRTEAELAFARARIATASRAADVEAPLDTVWVDLADEEGLEISARTALGFGFQGKMCIHPKQIAPVHRVFTPSEAEVAYAERVVTVFAEAEAVGSAAIQLDGKFIDYPILYRAQRVLEKMAAIRANGPLHLLRHSHIARGAIRWQEGPRVRIRFAPAQSQRPTRRLA